jgi:DNA-binding MarR family transcriptional regulator/N-acetylglutamate synthase-like GNAT family acetyltransferase
MKPPDPNAAIAAFRRFNRFYTKKIGVLGESLLESPFSLIEARILFELASRSVAGEPIFASELRAELGLDAGYLSRILSRFEKLGILSRVKSGKDGRRHALALEPKGWDYFRDLDARSSADAARTLAGLDALDRASLSDAMGRIEGLLDGSRRASFALRDPAPGDLGWVVSAHGELYSREYGYGPEFEALVARIVADFAAGRDPERERAWIAEREGKRLGSIFLVKVDERTAKLRLLLLVPEARGLGLGRRLVEECLAFARAAGYRKVTLWTNDSLAAARSIYAKAGFALVASAPDPMFSDGSLGETWELEL